MFWVLFVTIAFFYYGRGKIYTPYFKRIIAIEYYKKIDGFIFLVVTEIGLILSIANIILRYVYYPKTNLAHVVIIMGLAFFIRHILYTINIPEFETSAKNKYDKVKNRG